MHAMTEQNLINAFGGESQAHMRYLHFANQADTEKFPNVARLLRAVAHAEYVHAGDHYRALRHLNGGFVANSMAAFGPGNTEKNLGHAIGGETFEITEMYPVYLATAKLQKEKTAEKTFGWAYQAEQEHKRLFEKAMTAVKAGRDVKLGPVQICEVCGWTLAGEVPGVCPTSGAKAHKFKTFA